MDIKGARVLVTGASKGIGAAMAREFAAHGASVAVAARSTGAVEALAAELGGTAYTVDLTDDTQVDGFIARVEADGPIDVLVNNAGVATTAWLTDVEPDDIRAVTRLNLDVPIVLTNRVLPGMMDRGTGHLVFTSSLAGTAGFPGLTVYGATKAGLFNFVNALRLELKGTEVGTTIVAPGPVDTEMWDQVEDETGMAPTVRRLRRLQLLPTKSPDSLAARTVRAVADGKTGVFGPRRLSTNFWFTNAPSRLTALILRDVSTGPRA
jgi:short-subunit dehydrogenase